MITSICSLSFPSASITTPLATAYLFGRYAISHSLQLSSVSSPDVYKRQEVASAQRGAVEEIKRKQRVSGFNSIFCVASVPMAKQMCIRDRH